MYACIYLRIYACMYYVRMYICTNVFMYVLSACVCVCVCMCHLTVHTYEKKLAHFPANSLLFTKIMFYFILTIRYKFII